MEKREPMIETMSVAEASKLSGTTRQNIHLHIKNGNMKAQRGKEHKTEWRLTPEAITEFAQTNHNRLIASIGVFMFSQVLHESKLMSDEVFEGVKTDFKNIINVASTIDALQPAIEKMIDEFPFMREALQD